MADLVTTHLLKLSLLGSRVLGNHLAMVHLEIVGVLHLNVSSYPNKVTVHGTQCLPMAHFRHQRILLQR